MNNRYNELFSTLTESINTFISEVKNKDPKLMATEEWTVKDELCHIVFWHENYAANYEALTKDEDPPLPEDMSTINLAGVLSLREYPIPVLIQRFINANDSLYDSIVVKEVSRMTYSRGGRIYETTDFLEMITRHINTHAKQIKKATFDKKQ